VQVTYTSSVGSFVWSMKTTPRGVHSKVSIISQSLVVRFFGTQSISVAVTHELLD
jgi:hypothetical protein